MLAHTVDPIVTERALVARHPMPNTELIGLIALLLVVLTSPFLYDLAAALGMAR